MLTIIDICKFFRAMVTRRKWSSL